MEGKQEDGRRMGPPVTSMGTLNFFMKRTASAWPSRLRLKQPSLSAASESAPASCRQHHYPTELAPSCSFSPTLPHKMGFACHMRSIR